jgi:MFS family permease
MKAEGKGSREPITESFFRWGNLRVVLLVLFGGVAGQAVVWYGGMFYTLLFLLETLKVEPQAATLMVAAGLVLAAPFLVLFGWLSDRIGRKRIVLAGCLAAALSYHPIFVALTRHANPAAYEAARRSPVAVVAQPDDCSFLFDPTGKRGLLSSCDVARSRLAGKGIPYRREPAQPGAVAQVQVGADVAVPSFDGRRLAAEDLAVQAAAFDKALGAALLAAGYPERADPARVDRGWVIALVFLLALYATMVHAPMAAWLVELFPARIRYTSLSLPYHLGNGWFGGFLPVIAFALVAATGDVYSGLWYPIAIAVATTLIGALFVPETKDREISHYA